MQTQSPYRPLDPQFLADPCEGYRELRDHDPVHRTEDPPCWALSRSADVWDAVREFGPTAGRLEITRDIPRHLAIGSGARRRRAREAVALRLHPRLGRPAGDRGLYRITMLRIGERPTLVG